MEASVCCDVTDEVCSIRSNIELCTRYEEPDIMLKMARLRWAGCVIKTSHSEVQERIRNYNPQGKRRVGMPNVRWTDIINNDLRKACGDKRGWRRIVEEAKALSGL